MNLGSAFYAALAVVAVYAAGLLLSRRVVAAATGALAFGLGTALWSQAVIAEVYTLNALLVSVTIVVLLLWREHREDRYLLLSAFLVGLCLTNHLTSGLLLPAGLLLVALVDWRRLIDLRLVARGCRALLARAHSLPVSCPSGPRWTRPWKRTILPTSGASGTWSAGGT